MLKAIVWPEPFNFVTTPEEQKTSALFSFDENGVENAVSWMNERLSAERERWEQAPKNWNSYAGR